MLFYFDEATLIFEPIEVTGTTAQSVPLAYRAGQRIRIKVLF